MDLLKTIIIAIVQGLTEFLPVSSSGHIILFSEITGYEQSSYTLGLFLHLGTLVAVVIALFPSVKALFKPPYKKLVLLIVATIPSAVVGLLIRDLVDELFSDGKVLPFTFLLTGVLLFISQSIRLKNSPLKLKSSLIMGLGQTFALLPGLSRSGTTIASGLFSGADKDEVGEFSFLMSIPIIAGGCLVEVIKLYSSPSGLGAITIPDLLVGMLVSALVGVLVVKKMLDIVSKRSFTAFILYLTVLSAVCFVNYYLLPIW